MDAPHERPAGYRTQSLDTSYEAEQVLFEGYRRMTFAERTRRACDLFELGRQMALASLRERYPQDSEHRLRIRLAALTIDGKTLKSAFGWDPTESPDGPGPDPNA